MRILGIDYGKKRIGLAVSDESGAFALPVSVVQNGAKVLDEIQAVAELHAVKEIVLGESKDYQGKPNSIQEETGRFKSELERLGFTVHFEPEFMTSMHNERLQGKHDMSDASAAAIILQSYLDKKKA